MSILCVVAAAPSIPASPPMLPGDSASISGRGPGVQNTCAARPRWSWCFRRSDALKVERQLKGAAKIRKEALISGELALTEVIGSSSGSADG